MSRTKPTPSSQLRLLRPSVRALFSNVYLLLSKIKIKMLIKISGFWMSSKQFFGFRDSSTVGISHSTVYAKIVVGATTLLISLGGSIYLAINWILKDPNAFRWDERTWNVYAILIWILLFLYSTVINYWIVHPLLRPMTPYLFRGLCHEAFFNRVQNKYNDYMKNKCSLEDLVIKTIGSTHKCERTTAIDFFLMVGIDLTIVKTILLNDGQSHLIDEFHDVQRRSPWVPVFLVSYAITTITLVALVITFKPIFAIISPIGLFLIQRFFKV